MEGLGFRKPRAHVEAERWGDAGLLGPEMTGWGDWRQDRGPGAAVGQG